jgi:hypothetical protein
MTRIPIRTAQARVRALALAAWLATVAACSPIEPIVNEPQPDAPLGFFGLEFANVAPPRFSSLATGDIVSATAVWSGPLAESDVHLEPTGSSGLFALGDAVYVHAEFLLTNGTDAALVNPVLVAYHRAEFRAGSAVSQPVTVGGIPAPDDVVRSIAPTHVLYYEGSAADPDLVLLGIPSRSDFVAFGEAERPSLATHEAVETVFPYGFAVRGVDDPDTRVIPAGGQGQVHVAFALPRSGTPGGNLASFTWNAALLSLDHVRVAQAVQENHPDGWETTLARATDSEATAIVAIGPGVRSTPASFCDRVIGLPNVRTAGVDALDPDYATLVPDDGDPRFTGCEGAP